MQTKNFSQEHALLYDDFFPKEVSLHYLEKRKRLILQNAKKHCVALDVGCGTGRMLEALPKQISQGFGVDASFSMLKRAKKLSGKNVFLAESSSSALPFKANSFDLVFSIAVFHHLGEKSKIFETVKEMFRVTKKCGKIVIVDHNAQNFYWGFLIKRVPWDKGVRLVPERELVEALKKAGAAKIFVDFNSFVPDFAKGIVFRFFRAIESAVERSVFKKLFCASIAITAEKK